MSYLKNKYINTREVLDNKLQYNDRHLLAIRLPKEAVLQFFRKRVFGSKERWYKMTIRNDFLKPDAVILDYIADEKSNDIWLILEHESFYLTSEDECIEMARVYLDKYYE